MKRFHSIVVGASICFHERKGQEALQQRVAAGKFLEAIRNKKAILFQKQLIVMT